MKNLFIIFCILMSLPTQGLTNTGFSSAALFWKNLSSLPHPQNPEQIQGYAGMYSGTSGAFLIFAGGANFPDLPPWKGGKKKWWDEIFVAKRTQDSLEWISTGEFHLPQPMAYGASVTTPQGVVIIGGDNEQGPKKEVWSLNWDPDLKKIIIDALPPLPQPMSYISAVTIDGMIYVAGHISSSEEKPFLSLDLNQPSDGWVALPSWPGSPRNNAGLVVQGDGKSQKIYLLGGRNKQSNGISQTFADMYCFDPALQTWETSTPLVTKNGEAFPRSAFTTLPIGSGHILLIGGVTPEPFNTLEKLAIELGLDQSLSPSVADSLIKLRDSILIHHPGFSRSVFAFHTITRTWTQLESADFAVPVNATILPFDHSGMLISGEKSPGVRSPRIREIKLESHQSFGQLNYIILTAYLSVLVFLGFRVSRKQHDTSDYFKAGGRVPWWAAGISVFGTQLSAITFMAIPAKTFATDWTLFFLLMTIIMVSPLIIAWFLPFYRRLNLTTAYEYLELRFNRTVRLFGSFLYILLQLGRLGIVLLLPSLALAVVTGIEVETCILIMGSLSILYTVLGGIEAVIWTDVVQVIVLLGGALLSLVLILTSVDMGWDEFVALAVESGKTTIFDFRFDFTGTTIWVVLFGGFSANLVQYGSDQTVIQRYLTTKNEKMAARSIRTGAWMALPSALIFFSIGTALYLFYLQQPHELSPAIPNTDSIFPWYIATQLPDGISGILIAAIFAAAMSSLDSSMNSVSTVITTDFYQSFKKLTNFRIAELKFARIATIIIGVSGTGIALWMATIGIPSLWDQFNMLIGLFAGGLGGIFLSGILSKRTNTQGAIIGFIGSALIQVAIKYQTPINLQLYALTGLVSAFVLARLSSMFFAEPAPEKTNRLTIKSLISAKETLPLSGNNKLNTNE
jgi:SSS family solute:Na+ symporter